MVAYPTNHKKLEFTKSLILDNKLFDNDISDSNTNPFKPQISGNMIALKKQTETGEALQDLNASGVDIGTMHKEDKRTQSTSIQASGFTRFDVLREMEVIPSDIPLSLMAKRNFMSIGGWRAKQMENTAIGVSEKQGGRGFISKMTGMFSSKNE